MKLKDEDFLHVVRLTPLVSIDLVLIRDDKEILLGLRNNRPAKGYWFVPGGRIQKNETLSDAFRRIGWNEIGRHTEIADAKLIGAFEHFYDDCFADVRDIGTHYVVLAYRYDVAVDYKLGKHDLQHSHFEWRALATAAADDDVHVNTKSYLTQYKYPKHESSH